MGLEHRAKLDANQLLAAFCQALRDACSHTVNIEGKVTKDLALILKQSKYLYTEEFIEAIAFNLARLWKDRLSKL